MALTNPEINQLKQAYRTVQNAADAAGVGMSTLMGPAAPNGFTVTFSAKDATGVDIVAPQTFTSQNLTFDEAVIAYRDLRRSGTI